MDHWRRGLRSVAILVAAVFLLNQGMGCSRNKAAQKPGSQTTIGVSLASAGEGTGEILKRMMEENAQKENVKLVFQDAKDDMIEQEKGIEKLMAQKVKAVILQPVNVVEAKPLVERLEAQNIKVLALDKMPADTFMDGFIGPECVRIGEMQASFVGDAVRNGNVIILQGDKSDPVATEITEGNLSQLKSYPGIKVLMVRDHPEWNTDLAEKTTREALDSFNSISAILANNSKLAMAAAKVLGERDLAGKTVVVGAEIEAESAEAIRSGELTANVDKVPDMMATTAVKAAAQLAKGGTWDFERRIANGTAEVPARITPVRLITKDNLTLVESMVGKAKDGGGNTGNAGGDASGGGAGEGGDSGGDGAAGASGSGGGQGSSGDMTTEVKRVGDEIMIRIKTTPESEGGGEEGGGGSDGGGDAEGGSSGGNQ
jgi:D-xylose transport system substrate-binding protein